MGLYIWSQFYGFLVLPLLGAFAVSATATLAWIKLAADRWRTLWMSIAVFSFSATILALCQIQFHRDVVSAAKRLAPDCLDSRSFLDAFAVEADTGLNYTRAPSRAARPTVGVFVGETFISCTQATNSP